MEIINRIKNVLISPKTEWVTIEEENKPHLKVFTGYIVPLALIPAVAAFIGYGLIGYSVLGIQIGGLGIGIKYAISHYITMLGGVYLTAFVISLLAENFGSEKDFNKAFSLVAYAYTPVLIGGVFQIYYSLSILVTLTSIYSLYLLFIGLQPMMKTPAEKRVSYFIVSLVVMVAAYFILSLVLSSIFIRSLI